MSPLSYALVALALGSPAAGQEEDLARAAVARGALGEAEAALEPLGAQGDTILGDLLREAGHPELALAYYNQALRIDRAQERASLGLGRALIDLGRYDEAADVLDPLAASPSAEARWALGLALVRGSDVPGGLASLREARDMRGGEYSRSAADLYEYFLERYRAELEQAAVAGEQARAEGNWAAASRLLLSYALAVGDAPVEALAGARAALAAGHDPHLALRGFRMALDADPDNAIRAQALAGAGAARLRLDDPAGAAADFAGALALAPDDPEALFGAALALAHLGRFGESADHLARALGAAGDDRRPELLRVARAERVFTGRRADPRLRALVE